MIKADKQLTDEKLSWLQAECKSIDGLCGMTICGAHVPTILALLDAYQHPADAALADAGAEGGQRRR